MSTITVNKRGRAELPLPNVVQSTKKYDQFNLMLDNREIMRKHVEDLKAAIDENPQLAASQPILVNEHLEVIDGQHRLVALQEMKMPVHYVVVPNLRIRDARQINMLQKNWSPLDYAHSYAVEGLKPYQQYLDLRDTYEQSHSATLTAIYGGDVKGMHTEFRRGNLVIEDIGATHDRLQQLVDVQELSPNCRKAAFMRAYAQVQANPDYDHKRFLKKMREAGDSLMRAYGSDREFLRAIEEVYNYRIQEKNQLRLY